MAVQRLWVEPVGEHQYETLLPMIADYQRFYEVDQIDAERSTWITYELRA